jgi:ATP-dependent RNA helicase DeaD
MESLENFRKLGLSDTTLNALRAKGFEEPSPIQNQIIPLLLKSDSDVIGQAATGTGKTAAFALPIIERLEPGTKHVQAIVLTPTRELAIQVAEEINSLRGQREFRVIPVYGGQSIDQQLRKLKKGVDIVVGTPGRILDHLNRRSLKLNNITYMVLDEADEMLNMGFIDDMEKIMKETNPDKKTLLFSATMPRSIMTLAKKYMKPFEFVEAENLTKDLDLTEQIYFEVRGSDKFEALCRIMDVEPDFYGLIFCRTKIDVSEIAEKLCSRGYDADALHGDINQSLREKILGKFRKRQVNILVATDVAARGIDVQKLTHVINYSIPHDPQAYVHRIGRTGRAGNKGTAITFITPSEYKSLLYIQKYTNTKIRRAEVPKVGDILKIKKAKVIQDLAELIENTDNGEYTKWAEKTLEKYSPVDVVAALLKHSFQDDLDDSSYSDINNTHNAGNAGAGTTRLFVAMGKISGMNPKRLVDLIKETSGISNLRASDVQVLDKFSFVTVPFEQAEPIIESFHSQDRPGKSIITKAKPKK